MTNIRLLPVVVLAIAALLVLKTVGLVTNGGYVLTGVGTVWAAGASAASEGGGTAEADQTVTPAAEPTLEDASPTLTDSAPTLGEQPAEAGAGAPAAETATPPGAETPVMTPANALAQDVTAAPGVYCVESDATITESGEAIVRPPRTAEIEAATEAVNVVERTVPAGSFAPPVIDCLPSGDAIPMEIDADGVAVPLVGTEAVSGTEQQLLERLVARREELQQFEQDLALRASIVDAAEKRIEERAATLQALETQISTLVDQRQEMETGQFAGIVAMYEAMRPKDAASIFNNLDIDVLLRVAKTMSPRKMAPILAEMDAPRAQELTVKMADLADRPAAEMTPDDLAALPQIVGQ
ncbi:MotE family protein [Devosia sp.]|uniref:MotE family protein n=1 Tax=Devosia sp. TaxID=1871048 RepID=UPI002FC9F6C1